MSEQPTSPPPVNPVSGANVAGAADYSLLLSRYGDIMLKIGQLEAQVGYLTKQIDVMGKNESLLPGPKRVQEPQGLSELTLKVEALERAAADPHQAGGDDGSEGSDAGTSEDDRRDDEFRQMRLKITSLANQLAQAQDQLQEVLGHRGRHRRQDVEGEGASRHRRQTPLWKKIAHRVGLR